MANIIRHLFYFSKFFVHISIKCDTLYTEKQKIKNRRMGCDSNGYIKTHYEIFKSSNTRNALEDF